VLLASEEGISWFGCGADGNWRQVLLGTGEQTQYEKTGFRGSGNVAFGRIGHDPYAFLATVEPFHGNTVAVYSKHSPSLYDLEWKRVVLDVFGDPNDRGEGAGHHVVTADFDGDGDDEFLVGLRGPMPWEGVFYYKAVDVDQGLWTKTRVSSSSAARIAVADSMEMGGWISRQPDTTPLATFSLIIPKCWCSKTASASKLALRVSSGKRPRIRTIQAHLLQSAGRTPGSLTRTSFAITG
jgi:hypothetical protein